MAQPVEFGSGCGESLVATPLGVMAMTLFLRNRDSLGS